MVNVEPVIGREVEITYADGTKKRRGRLLRAPCGYFKLLSHHRTYLIEQKSVTELKFLKRS